MKSLVFLVSGLILGAGTFWATSLGSRANDTAIPTKNVEAVEEDYATPTVEPRGCSRTFASNLPFEGEFSRGYSLIYALEGQDCETGNVIYRLFNPSGDMIWQFDWGSIHAGVNPDDVISRLSFFASGDELQNLSEYPQWPQNRPLEDGFGGLTPDGVEFEVTPKDRDRWNNAIDTGKRAVCFTDPLSSYGHGSTCYWLSKRDGLTNGFERYW